MESPRKYHDCYFYYYSTCTKGDNCVFRHEPAALGCETMCTAWQEGKCLDKKCRLRHMELKKNRKQILCYWETQPGGCRKKHCPFMHKNPEARTDGIPPSNPIPVGAMATMPSTSGLEHPEAMPLPMPVPMPAGMPGGVPSGAPPAPGGPVPLLWQQPQRPVVLDSAILGVLPASELLLPPRRLPEPYAAPDPLVVHFDEEPDSDAPGAPGSELRLLRRVQAAAAALYRYDHPAPDPAEPARKRKAPRRETVVDPANKIVKLVRSNSVVYKKVEPPPPPRPERRPGAPAAERGAPSDHSDDDELEDHSDQFTHHAEIDAIEAPRLYISNNITKKPRVNRDKVEISVGDDNEVQIVGESILSKPVTVGEVIDLDEGAADECGAVVDLSDDEVRVSDLVYPDVVTSCRRRASDSLSNDDYYRDICANGRS